MDIQHHTALPFLPDEIIGLIFDFVCNDRVDLSLLRVSRRFLLVLRDHNIVRTAQACVNVKSTESTCVTYGHHLPPSGKEDNNRWSLPLSLASRPWCTFEFLSRFERMMIDKVFRDCWYPLLSRDGCQDMRVHRDNLRQRLLDMMTRQKAETQWCMRCSRVPFPWSQAVVWPLEGVVVIRDRLTDMSWRITLPLIRDAAWKSRIWRTGLTDL